MKKKLLKKNLSKEIQYKQKLLYGLIENYDLLHKEVINCSMELDELILKYFSIA